MSAQAHGGDMGTVDEIRAAVEQATQGEWEWHGVAAPDWMPHTFQANDGIRVTTLTPHEFYDAEIVQVIEGMKSGFMMVRNADADLIENAPKWLAYLLAENERLARVFEAAKGYIASPEAGHTYHVPTQNAFAALVNALEACEKGAE